MLKQKLLDLFANDAEFISVRDAHYESSWKARGGIGAFMTICRPWDRFEAIAKRKGWDIFRIIQEEIDAGKTEADDGTLQACIRDLRAYMALLAVEARGMRAATTPTARQETATHGADESLRQEAAAWAGPLAVPSPREEAPSDYDWWKRRVMIRRRLETLQRRRSEKEKHGVSAVDEAADMDYLLDTLAKLL